MKALRIVGVVVAFGCMGVAGWRLRDWASDDRGMKVPVAMSKPQIAVKPPQPPGEKLPPSLKPAKFLLTQVQLNSPTPTDDAWLKSYQDLRGQPGSQAGFTAVALPWRFSAEAGTDDADAGIAKSVAFLICGDLDWSPASGGSRPTFGVFNRSAKLLADLSAAYQAKTISTLVRGWKGTHAVGGAIVRAKGGNYLATLEIYDRDGKLVNEKDVAGKDLFDLVGNLSCAALTYFKTPANAELDKHLHRKRCEQAASLALLGKAAFLPEFSAQEQAVYDEVLENDPHFADVRAWRAQSGQLNDPSSANIEKELMVSLAAAVTPAALQNLQNPGKTSKVRELPPTLVDAIRAAERLAGPDHPLVMGWKATEAAVVRLNHNSPTFNPEQFKPYRRLAARYPDNGWYLQRLMEGMTADDYNGSQLAPYDPEVIASLAVADLKSNSSTSRTRAYDWYRLAEAAREAARPGDVMAATRRCLQESRGMEFQLDCRAWQADAMMQTGQFNTAASAMSQLARETPGRYRREGLTEKAVICAVLGNRVDVIDSIALDPSLNVGKIPTLIGGCRKFLDGKPISTADFAGNGGPIWPISLLLAEAELNQGGDFNRVDRPRIWRYLSHRIYVQQSDRLRWVLLDQYYRRQPTLPGSAGFYDALEWRFPDDPWVRKVVADWRQRGSPGLELPSSGDVAKEAARMSWSGEELPATEWTIMARIRKDLEAGKPDDARNVLKSARRALQSTGAAYGFSARKLDEASPDIDAP